MQRNLPIPQNKNAVPLLEKDLTDKIIGVASVLPCLRGSTLEENYE
jgi:hypothetical protein